MKKSLLSLLLVLAMLSVSCGSETVPETDTAASADSPATETEATADPYADALPEGLTFAGEDMKIFIGDVHIKTTTPTYVVEETNGEVVNDAVFNRNLTVSERLDLNLVWDYVDFDYGSRKDYSTRIENAVLTNDGSMDLICGPGFYTTNMVTENYFLDISTVPYIDLSKPYWTKMYNDNARINGKIYSALGDFSLNKLMLSYALFFNKDLFDNAAMEYPYETVLEGKWTLDAMETLIQDTYMDVNGDGKAGLEDTYGFQSESDNMLWAFMDPCGIKVFDVDNNGSVQFVMDNEHNATAIARLNRFCNENANVYHESIADDSITAFLEGRSYITPGNLMATAQMRDVDFAYGILPYPKYQESDAHYTTRTSSAISVFFIPVICSGLEKTGALLEAMNAESSRTVLPAYYETALKHKYLGDEVDAQVLDLINSTITTQFVDIFSEVFPNYSSTVRDVLSKNKETWASDVAKIKPAALEKLDALLAYYYGAE